MGVLTDCVNQASRESETLRPREGILQEADQGRSGFLAGTLAAAISTVVFLVASPPAFATTLSYVDARAQVTAFLPGDDGGIFSEYDARSGASVGTFGNTRLVTTASGGSPNVAGLTSGFAAASACYAPPTSGTCFAPFGATQTAGSDAASSV